MSTQPATLTETPLKRVITRPMLIIFVIGDILGAGIYAVVGQVAGAVGGAIWASFLLAFTLALFTCFAYAELVTKYPRAAGAALYVQRAFGVPFVTFVIAVTVMASGITSASTSARAFGGDYLAAFIDAPVLLMALGFLLALELINFVGISQSVRLNVVLSLIEASGLLFVIGIGVVVLANGTGDPARVLEFSADQAVPLAILSGAGIAFFSFVGFEDSVNVAEETQEPNRAYPIALFGGLLGALVIYLLVTVTASMVVDPGTLAESSGPLLEVVRAGVPGFDERIFAAVALVAVSNTALINLIMASRLLYGLARQGIVPAVFARVHGTRKTPWIAIVATALIAAVLVSTGELGGLASTTVILLLIVFTLVNISVLVLRREPVDHDHYHAPSIFPMLGAVTSAGLVLYRVIQEPADVVRALVLIAVGIVLWGINRIATGRVTTINAEELED
jgi:APA family basic amino acid/polyamine antiporter